MTTLTREELISALIEELRSGDEETIYDRALACYRREIEGMTPAALKAEYEFYVGDP